MMLCTVASLFQHIMMDTSEMVETSLSIRVLTTPSYCSWGIRAAGSGYAGFQNQHVKARLKARWCMLVYIAAMEGQHCYLQADGTQADGNSLRLCLMQSMNGFASHLWRK